MMEAERLMRSTSHYLYWMRWRRQLKRIDSVFGDDITNASQVFEQNFITGVRNLKAARDAGEQLDDLFAGFFFAYGTHFISKAMVGAAANVMISVDTSRFQHAQSSFMQECASETISAGGAGMIKKFLVGGSASRTETSCSSESSSSRYEEFQSASQQSVFLQGGDPDMFFCGDEASSFSRYVDSVLTVPDELFAQFCYFQESPLPEAITVKAREAMLKVLTWGLLSSGLWRCSHYPSCSSTLSMIRRWSLRQRHTSMT